MTKVRGLDIRATGRKRAGIICPKCGSTDCERFVESDAPAEGVDVICKECGELFKEQE